METFMPLAVGAVYKVMALMDRILTGYQDSLGQLSRWSRLLWFQKKEGETTSWVGVPGKQGLDSGLSPYGMVWTRRYSP